mmetsp:Transcript_16200/g.27917  ORF Transcript_16200/g.27917 Transcript_16200/m.27917 type:complete len:99 (+) Transcript_16200:1-297(+)
MEFGLTAATKTINQNMVKFYYDAEEKKTAKITTSMTGEKVIDIADYSDKKRYVITSNGTKCNVTKLNEEHGVRPHCCNKDYKPEYGQVLLRRRGKKDC